MRPHPGRSVGTLAVQAPPQCDLSLLPLLIRGSVLPSLSLASAPAGVTWGTCTLKFSAADEALPCLMALPLPQSPLQDHSPG